MTTRAPTAPPTTEGSKGVHILLWIVQALLALAFLNAGIMKIVSPWTSENPIPNPLFRFIGIAEVAGAIGLIVPAATRIRPNLTPLAGLCLAVVMLLATVFHITRDESVTTTVVLGILALFVAWGRTRLAPIRPR